MAVDPSNASAGVDPSRAPRVAGAIKQAASATGASFEYLLTTAKMESDFNPAAGASTSSAHGLFQFIEQTWLGTVKEAGAQLGFGAHADAITKSPSGTYSVSDPAKRQSIMKLRDDPQAASAMAAVLTQSNSFKLTGMLGRRPTDSELYMAHFMGVGGAAKLIANAEDNPQASAARLFPNAAASNRSIFFERDGRARNVYEVYSVLTQRYAAAAGSPATRSAMAIYGDAPSIGAVASAGSAVPVIDNAAYLQTFPDTRANAAVTLASASDAGAPPRPPMFRSLFQADANAQPVSSTVQALWGNSSSLTSVPGTTPNGGAAQPLDLFSDRSGSFSS
ncbi:transglycosylase SLT domain-containing protein [Bradyrhizobium sp. NP1]|uniref:transglycosylase SLT domain-containing protein n=1 Tax=Bradyrhizobium sp. NP1 TaxID=3049772 RepID=UPI0025A54803|nr:transglycosylase SLT domain-containing protein [Bradyrhizobium sp. NP1]WJR75955.1 lytic transglycosylase domain-containing protein [Bradyrhizobium sp. NP1]